MENFKEIGLEIDDILSCLDLTDEQKIKVAVHLLNKETNNSKEMVPEDLFRRAFYKAKKTDRNLVKIRGYISLSYALSYNEFSKFSAIRMFRHISKFTEEQPRSFSTVERKQMREYIKRKFFINF